MYDDYLIKVGLTAEEAKVYQSLLKHGPSTARLVHLRTSLKRGLTYKILDDLTEQKVIEKDEKPGKIAIFKPLHPNNLLEILEQKKKAIETAGQALQGVLPQLSSDYNLITGKPGVRFFEGDSGIRQVIEDSLTTKGEILSYIDNETALKYFDQINKDYVKKRTNLGIKKRMITLDTPYIHGRKDSFNRDLTDLHLLQGDWKPFSVVVYIYDQKVSLITLTDTAMIGIIIEDPIISHFQKTIFEYCWINSKPLWPEQP